MKKFSDRQVQILVSALADHVRHNEAAAAAFAEQGYGDPVGSIREVAVEAETLRQEFAAELHRRGRTSCDLAHPGRDCPNA